MSWKQHRDGRQITVVKYWLVLWLLHGCHPRLRFLITAPASVLIITDSVFTHAFQDELLLFLIVAALLQATAQIRPGIERRNSDYDCRWNSFALVTLHLFYFLSKCCVFPHAGALYAVVGSVSTQQRYRNAVWCCLRISERSAEVSFSIALQATLLCT